VTSDATLRLETPEGIDVELQPAGPVARALALLVDETIAQIGTIACAVLAATLGEAGVGAVLVIYFLIEWFYPVFFEVLRQGQTPGKQVMGLRVVSADATPIGWNDSLVRNLLRVVDFLPFFYLAGLVSLVVTRRFQRLGDLAANSVVVHDDRVADRTRNEDEEADPLERLGAAPLPLPLGVEERRAIVGFIEREAGLSDERAIELADLLEGVTGSRGEAGHRQLVRIANGIAGGE